jgi:hypothetical protein
MYYKIFSRYYKANTLVLLMFYHSNTKTHFRKNTHLNSIFSMVSPYFLQLGPLKNTLLPIVHFLVIDDNTIKVSQAYHK